MKKKIKIFSTIASLCLAVALMAFGVYAAASIKLTATSTVTFKATEIKGYWSACVYSDDDENEITGTHAGTTPTEVAGTRSENNESPAVTVDIASVNLKSIDQDGTTTVVYKFTFTELGDVAAQISVTPTVLDADTAEEVDGYSIAAAASTKEGKVHTVLVTLTVDGATLNTTVDSTMQVKIICEATKA